MQVILAVGLSFVFALFWLWWYYRQDKYEREPKRLIALVFLLSMPFSVLTGLFQFSLDGGNRRQLSESTEFWVVLLFYFVIVGVTEEVAKFIVTYIIAYRHKEFNEPMDGIIYAATSALGFATFENVFFVLDQGTYIIFLRGPVSTLGHVLFSGIWGAALGRAKFDGSMSSRWLRIAGGLGLAIVAHGIFDVLISLGHFFPEAEWLSLSSLLFLGLLYYFVSRQINYALHVSDFNPSNVAVSALQRLRELRRRERNEPPEDQNDANYVPNPYKRDNKNAKSDR